MRAGSEVVSSFCVSSHGYARAAADYDLVSVPEGKGLGNIPGLRAFTASRSWVVRHDPDRKQVGVVLFRGTDSRDEGLGLGLDWRATELPTFSRDDRFLAWGTAEGAVLVAEIEMLQARIASLKLAR